MSVIQENSAVASPHALYERLLREKQEQDVQLKRRDRVFVYAKVSVALLAVLFLLRYLQMRHGVAPLLGVAALFVALVVGHEIVLARMRAVAKSIAFHERGLARLEDRWAGTGEQGGGL